MATALVVLVAFLWSPVRNELDRAPLAPVAGTRSLAPTAAIGVAPFPTFSTDSGDSGGVGPGSRTVDLADGVYVASVYGDMTKLDVTMRTLHGRGSMPWGQTQVVSFAVGEQGEASLYHGPARIVVVPATDDRQWGILLERYPYPGS